MYINMLGIKDWGGGVLEKAEKGGTHHETHHGSHHFSYYL